MANYKLTVEAQGKRAKIESDSPITPRDAARLFEDATGKDISSLHFVDGETYEPCGSDQELEDGARVIAVREKYESA